MIFLQISTCLCIFEYLFFLPKIQNVTLFKYEFRKVLLIIYKTIPYTFKWKEYCTQ